MKRTLGTLTHPVIGDNPITVQILGICSALAVTTSLATALVMCAALTAVLTVSCGLISTLRHQMPQSIRLIVQITIIASLVIVVDEILKAYAFEISKRLSVFVGLIITNCIVLGRAEAFAMRNPVGASLLDGLGNGIGYSLILIVIGTIRELLGAGTLLGYSVLATVAEGGWFTPLKLMLLAPSAFFLLGFLVWAVRSWRRDQVEQPEFRIRRPAAGGRP
ncbi:MAG: NADH:ubiquinone reductase (Na(+)-transporting) subunit D [Alphaproteobacteria bacterium]|nr:NADH:ubiquinone reductase (Na(+)-transporting) subunit D [Alphaproteobacteria bacterium]